MKCTCVCVSLFRAANSSSLHKHNTLFDFSNVNIPHVPTHFTKSGLDSAYSKHALMECVESTPPGTPRSAADNIDQYHYFTQQVPVMGY